MRISILVALFSFSIMGFAQSQTFKPAMEGIAPLQEEGQPGGFNILFKNNLMNKDWIYGSYVGEDSLTRCVAYRHGGRWVSLPFSGYYGNYATDMAMYGDTLYIAGAFGDVVIDGTQDTLPPTSLLKYFNDSVWCETGSVYPTRMSALGDSLLIYGATIARNNNPAVPHAINYQDGTGWHYPYSIAHPTGDSSNGFPDFFPGYELRILPNGDILTLNNGSPQGSPYKGVVRWDGNQWYNYGNGIFGGGYTHALDFEFYRGELYMGGTFDQVYTYYGDTIGLEPRNPGNGVVRWDGSKWQSLAGGVLEGGIRDMFVHNDVLYCQTFAGVPEYHLFGDAQIPNLAGWDGNQWCGTPLDYDFFPLNYGVVNDTLFMVVKFVYWDNPTIAGQPVSYMNYFDGDYLRGPNSICSTPGLGEEKVAFTNEEVKVYPNPVKDELHVSLPEDIKEATYQLMALDGKLVTEGKLKAGENTLTVSEKLNGVFLLKLSSFGGEIVRKVVFEN